MAKFDDTERLRLQIAQQAARLISDHGIQDFRQAKMKAAVGLKARGRAALPTNSEIQSALVAHQSLFGAQVHTDRISELRRCALLAMVLLENFSPRLVGPVLAGTAALNAPVNLHVFSDSPEDVLWCVEASGRTVASFERRLKSRRDTPSLAFPGYRFSLDEASIEATVFAYDGLRQAPISPVDGKPMRRASKTQVEALTAADTDSWEFI